MQCPLKCVEICTTSRSRNIHFIEASKREKEQKSINPKVSKAECITYLHTTTYNWYVKHQKSVKIAC